MKIGTETVYMDTDSIKKLDVSHEIKMTTKEEALKYLLKDKYSLASEKHDLNVKFGMEQERLNHLVTWIEEHRQKEYHPRIAKIVKTDGTMAGYVVTMNEEEMLALADSLLDYADLLNDRAGEEPDFHISIIGEI